MTSSDPATIFLTGSSGLVGCAIRRKLARTSDFNLVPLPRGALLPVDRLSPRDAVLHAAWPSSDETAWTPFLQWSVNLRSSANECGTWFIALGSGVDDYADHPGLGEPYHSYARRKVELRKALTELCADKLVWLRLHFMFGEGEKPSRLVPAAIRAGAAGEPFACGSLDRRRRWLHVDDQADYLLRFLTAPEEGLWDIAGRYDVSFRDLLELVGRAIGRKLQVKESDAPVPDSALEAIVPERMARVVPSNAGSPESLLGRLREYAAQLGGISAGAGVRTS